MQNLKTIGKATYLISAITACTVLATHNTDVYDTISLVHRKCTDFVTSCTSVSNPLYVVSIIYAFTLIFKLLLLL